MKTGRAGEDRKASTDEGIISPRRGRNDPALGPDVVLAAPPHVVNFLVKKTGGERLPVHDLALSWGRPRRCSPWKN